MNKWISRMAFYVLLFHATIFDDPVSSFFVLVIVWLSSLFVIFSLIACYAAYAGNIDDIYSKMVDDDSLKEFRKDKFVFITPMISVVTFAYYEWYYTLVVYSVAILMACYLIGGILNYEKDKSLSTNTR